MKQTSLADISYEDGLQLLYLRKQAYDAGTLSRRSAEELAASHSLTAAADSLLQKEAADPWYKGITDSVGDFASKAKGVAGDLAGQAKSGWQGLTPEARNAIMTSGVGAGLGMTAGALSSDKRKKNRFRNMLLGGLAGGAVGGGLGLAVQPKLQEQIGKKLTPFIPDTSDSKSPGAPAAPGKSLKDQVSSIVDNADKMKPQHQRAYLDAEMQKLLDQGADPSELQTLMGPSIQDKALSVTGDAAGLAKDILTAGGGAVPATAIGTGAGIAALRSASPDMVQRGAVEQLFRNPKQLENFVEATKGLAPERVIAEINKANAKNPAGRIFTQLAGQKPESIVKARPVIGRLSNTLRTRTGKGLAGLAAAAGLYGASQVPAALSQLTESVRKAKLREMYSNQ